MSLAWSLRHAARDARSGWRRLLLYVAAIVAGVAALVAIRSFADNLTSSVDAQAKTLLGADLEIYGRAPFDDASLALLERFGDERIRETSLGTMAYFPRTGDSRLVRLRAVESGYPYYGELDTEPPGATAAFSRQEGALVDRTLMLQFGIEVGESLRIGALEIPIVGALRRIPGEVPTASLIGPRVLIPFTFLDTTELLGPGSQARYSLLFRLPDDPETVTARVEEIRPQLRERRLEAETVQYRRRVVGRALDNLYQFLYLAGFAALLLGGIGVGSAMSLHARDKVTAVAVLRCLGARPWLPVRAYLLQALVMALVGSLLGAVAGVAAQLALPRFVDSFLPLPIRFAVSPTGIAEGMLTGLVTAVLFAALPLVPLRRITPFEALRLFADVPPAARRDPWIRGLVVGLAAVLWGTAWRQTHDGWEALGILVGLTIVTLTLAVAAIGLRAAARRAVFRVRSYPTRQGMANLYRPRNQTVLVMVALGFGTFVIGSLLILQESLLAGVEAMAAAGDANFVLFDLQPDQRTAARELLTAHGVPVLQDTPIVPMRLASLAGRPIAQIGPNEGLPGWALRREYSSTYRAALDTSEELVAGAWVAEASLDEPPIPVSIERDLAADLRIGVGDELAFDVQGVVVPVVVASLRLVDWQQVRPNFFVVFPTGVLESAPHQIAMVTRVGSPEASATLQRQIVERFRNVSVIDLGLVLRTIDDVLAQVVLAIRFMTLFVIAAGVAVLLVAVRTSRHQRQQESVLLRTLGASRRQLLRIQAVEYAALGVLAAATGLLLATVGSAVMLHFVFESPTRVPWANLAIALLGTSLLTTVVGLWGTRQATRRPPLESLRAVR